MRIDSALLKQERNRRAWSQEHLARVSGLGLRTIQRVESSGMASNETISAIASVFEMPVADFLKLPQQAKPAGLFQKYRVLIALVTVLVANIASPPELSVALAGLWLWLLFELAALFAGRAQREQRV